MVHGDRNGDEQAEEPAGGQRLVGVRQRLPGTRLQGAADGEVALQGDGHQREAAHCHGHSWKQRRLCQLDTEA